MIDPGTITVENGVRRERGFEAECVFIGDVSGVIRFTRSSTLENGDGPFTEWEGPAWGRTIVTVSELYGEPVLNGTFRGPYRTDWQTLITGGEFKLVRVGTGDLRGLVMFVTAMGENFGQFINETGVIIGKR